MGLGTSQFAITAAAVILSTPAACAGAGFSTPEKQVYVTYDSSHSAAKWENGYLLHVQVDSGTVVVHDRSGNLKISSKITVPDARTTVYNIAASPSGKFAAGGTSFGSGGQIGSFIAWLDEKGSVERLVRTSPFFAMSVCFAHDGTLWALGREHDGEYKAEVPGHSILRHYTPDGKLLNTALSVDTFGRRTGVKGTPHPGSMSQLGATPTGIGVYSLPTNEYVEVSNSGAVIGRWQGVPRPQGRLLLTGIAVTRAGWTYVSTQQRDTPDGNDYMAVFRLDKETRQWTRIHISDDTSKENRLILHGLDGDSLVVRDMRTGIISWVRDTTVQR